MNALMHQLRKHHSAWVPGLVVVLLMTWLAVLCPHCLAEAAAAPANTHATQHCHSDVDHTQSCHDSQAGDCCQTAATHNSCQATDCAEFAAVTQNEAQVPLLSGATFLALPAAMMTRIAPLSGQVAYANISASPQYVSSPLYLRHCSFLN